MENPESSTLQKMLIWRNPVELTSMLSCVLIPGGCSLNVLTGRVLLCDFQMNFESVFSNRPLGPLCIISFVAEI